MAENRDRRDYEEDELWDDDDDAQKDKFLTFKIGAEDYGIPIGHVIEIVGIQKITEVPDMPDFVRGVINLRGQVIPVMDLRTRFKMPPRDYDERTCVIVVRLEECSVGLVVDTVNEVINIPEANISPPPSLSKTGSGRYIMGMGRVDNNVKILLDTTRLLYDRELEAITSAI